MKYIEFPKMNPKLPSFLGAINSFGMSQLMKEGGGGGKWEFLFSAKQTIRCETGDL